MELVRQHYKKMLNDCNRIFKKRNNDHDNPFNIINQIKPNIIEQGLKTALLTDDIRTTIIDESYLHDRELLSKRIMKHIVDILYIEGNKVDDDELVNVIG